MCARQEYDRDAEPAPAWAALIVVLAMAAVMAAVVAIVVAAVTA